MTSGIKTYPFPKGFNSFKKVENYLANLVADLEEDQILRARDVSSASIVPIMTPVSGATSGTPSNLAQDENFLYVCTAPDTWKSIPLTTFGAASGQPTILNLFSTISDYTWDGTFRTIDYTSRTSSSARWVILSIIFTAASYKVGYFAPSIEYADGYGPSIWLPSLLYQTAPANAWIYSGVIWVPLQADQTAAYSLPAGTTVKYLYLLGYV